MAILSYAGIDVSQKSLDIAVRNKDGSNLRTATFANDPDGHKKLLSWLTKAGRSAQVVLEATGTYSLDIALCLQRHKRVEVMVANPRSVHNFAKARSLRSSTDATMARALLEFCARMDFLPWTPPSPTLLELRTTTRRIDVLTQSRSRERNRAHALEASKTMSAFVRNDIDVSIRHTQRRIDLLRTHALELIDSDPDIRNAYDCIISISGIAHASAIQLLGELLLLPKNMNVRQWVAHAGLDVRHVESGTSVHKRPRISKQGNLRLRRALYIPAMVAAVHQPHVRCFQQQLLAKGKAPLQVRVAVMRKLLHSIFGMLRDRTVFDGSKFRIIPDLASAA